MSRETTELIRSQQTRRDRVIIQEEPRKNAKVQDEKEAELEAVKHELEEVKKELLEAKKKLAKSEEEKTVKVEETKEKDNKTDVQENLWKKILFKELQKRVCFCFFSVFGFYKTVPV